jgi:hypothetical protein
MLVVEEVVVLLAQPLEQEVQAVEVMAQLEQTLRQLLVVLEPLILVAVEAAELAVHL